MKFWASTAFMHSDELIDLARLLDGAGYHGVTVSDHVCYPQALESPYPYSPHEDGVLVRLRRNAGAAAPRQERRAPQRFGAAPFQCGGAAPIRCGGAA
jgi:alkanesulfonate monooxygenase SsuD/methylene tetrahydromethanopterin reductase-like flavin-dependent oxidoreductase (luciferase family)